jgi:hypothetical protein
VRTAQETYLEMVREHIAPRLRALGFRGSGSVYRLPDEDSWRLLGFQRSRSSDRQRVKFTINLTFANKAAWLGARSTHPWIGDRPTGIADYVLPGRVVEVVRIGALIPGQDDVWWELHAGDVTEPLANEIVDAIEAYALPWLLLKHTGAGAVDER